MSGLILCQEKRAVHPLYVGELGLHVYDGAELSYYIYTNVLLINEEFIGEPLFEFLDQLGHERLSERVRKLTEQKMNLSERLLYLLQELHYYSGTELFSLKKELEELAQAAPAARLKAKGDYLFRLGQYYNALRIYDGILDGDSRELADSAFVGLIWANRGSCFARLEAFGEALDSYYKAWLLNGDRSLLEQMYVLGELGGLALPADAAAVMTEEDRNQFACNLEDHRRLAQFSGKALEAEVLWDKPQEEQAGAFRRLLESWKEEYRRNRVNA